LLSGKFDDKIIALGGSNIRSKNFTGAHYKFTAIGFGANFVRCAISSTLLNKRTFEYYAKASKKVLNFNIKLVILQALKLTVTQYWTLTHKNCVQGSFCLRDRIQKAGPFL
jgi:hypothetical protein